MHCHKMFDSSKFQKFDTFLFFYKPHRFYAKYGGFRLLKFYPVALSRRFISQSNKR